MRIFPFSPAAFVLSTALMSLAGCSTAGPESGSGDEQASENGSPAPGSGGLGGPAGTGGTFATGGASGTGAPATGGVGGDVPGTGGNLQGTGGGANDGRFDVTPSNPNANCQARALLQYLTDISGQNILSGQESMLWDAGPDSFPTDRDSYIHQRVGKYPAVYSSDFGDFDHDTLEQRHRVADVARAYHEQGSLIQLHYHMIQPNESDGSGFDTMHGFSDGNKYQHMDDILTPGHALQVEHLKRLDEVAGYLKELQDSGVPVLWRPYHEMNGPWFWWGKQARYKELWIQMHDYFTDVHGLDNLLWVWSANWWASDQELPDVYYPGHEYVDVLGVDIYVEYGASYDDRIHDHLFSLGGGRPIAITENGEMPHVPSMKVSQPQWVYWATWWGFEDGSHGNTDGLYADVYGDAWTLTQDEVELPACP